MIGPSKMNNVEKPIDSIKFFKPIAYLTIFGVSVGGILAIDLILERWEAMFLIVIFGFLLSQYPPIKPELNNKRAFWLIMVQAFLIAVLMQESAAAQIFAILIFILSAAAGLYFSLQLSLGIITILTLMAFVFLLRFYDVKTALQLTLSLAGGYYFFGIVANSLIQLQRAQWTNQQLVHELISKNKLLEDYARQIETLAIEQERSHLAREVHDTLGHRLTITSVQLEGAQKILYSQPERARQMLATAHAQVRSALFDLRKTVNRLREPLEMDLPLDASLIRLVNSFIDATGLEIQMTNELPGIPLKTNQHITIFRTVQEALTNIQKHAQASCVLIHLYAVEDKLILKIKDDGIGFEQKPDDMGFGLKGMFERATLLNGSFNILSNPGAGTELHLEIPLGKNEVV